MAAVGIRPDVAGAALVLGASFGGDLLNPGAQDVQALAAATGLPARAVSDRVRPAGLVGLLVAAVTFTLRNRRPDPPSGGALGPVAAPTVATPVPSPRLNPAKAVVPLVPVMLLLLAYAGWTPLAWLLRPPPGDQWRPLAGALPVVRAMLIGTLLAAALGWRDVQRVIRDLFQGMGAAYGDVISLTIAAQCFGAGIAAIGLGEVLLKLLGGSPWALAALAIGFPWGLSALSGSGSGPVLAFAQTFLAPLGPRPNSVLLGALACLAAAFGRTMSPVSAVVIYGSGLVGVSPLALVQRLLPALLAGAAMALVTALVLG
jgi:DcuC family C4-dicarboxylate transporter